VRGLIDLLLAEFPVISRHSYGNFVVQNLLQHSAEEQQLRLRQLVEQFVSELALHPHGCAVLSAALEHGDLADRRVLAEMVLESSDEVAFMAGTRHADAIITGLLDALDSPGRNTLFALAEEIPKLEDILKRRSEELGCDC